VDEVGNLDGRLPGARAIADAAKLVLTGTAAPRYKPSMSEEKIVAVVNEALASAGIDDTVIAAGEFKSQRRGSTRRSTSA
jgi:hypothetical protein